MVFVRRSSMHAPAPIANLRKASVKECRERAPLRSGDLLRHRAGPATNAEQHVWRKMDRRG